MSPAAGICRLCLCYSTEIKDLVDEDGQYNYIYEIAVIYFEPKLLTEAICENCWQHIYEFYEYQQSVLKAQTDLENVENNESIVKLEIMLIDNDEVDKEDPKEDLNVYKIDLQQPIEDEIPLMLMAEKEVYEEIMLMDEEEVNKEDPKEDLNVSAPYEIDLQQPIEDEIPLMLMAEKEVYEEIMLMDEEEVDKEDPKEDLNVSAPYEIDLKQPIEDEIPLMLTAEEEVNDEYLKETPIASISNSFDLKDTNPFESEDEIPLGEHSITNIQEFEDVMLTETRKHIENVKKLHKIPAITRETYQCPYCATIFLIKKNIYRHVKSCHPNEKYSFNAENLKCVQKEIILKANVTKKDAVSKEDSKIQSPNKGYSIKKIKKITETKKHIKSVKKLDPESSDEFSFACIFCDKKFKSDLNLLSHTRIHTHGRGAFECPYCDRTFVHRKNVKCHVKLHHSNENSKKSKSVVNRRRQKDTHAPDVSGSYQCPYCENIFLYRKNVKSHVERHHPNECADFIAKDLKCLPKALFQCPHCASKSLCLESLRSHIKSEHPLEYIDPDVPNEPKVDLNLIGRDLQSTEEHSPNYYNIDAFIAKWKPDLECSLCQNTFTSWHLLGTHFKNHHPDKKNHVTCCEQKLLSRQLLADHLRLHLDPNSFKCEICGRCVSTSYALRRHRKIHTGIKPFQCEVCRKSFRTRIKLLIHIGTHSTERNVICKVCNRGFATKLILDKHVYYKHNNRYLCEQCGKHCDNESAFKEHLLVHAGGDKPKWPCDQCDMEFSSRLALGSHINMIHIEAIYVCTGCGENLNSKPNFDLHNKSVHGGKCKFKFKCIECDKEIRRAQAFRQHADVHNGVARYQCPHCPIILKHKKNIARHIKTLHPLEISEIYEPAKYLKVTKK